MSNMRYTKEELLAKVRGLQKSSGGDGPREYPTVCFLPEGKHKVRFILDSAGEFISEYFTYGFFARGIRDPFGLPKEQLPPNFENKLQIMYDEFFKARLRYKYGSKKNCLAYVYIYETTVKGDERWKPGNLVVANGNGKFGRALINWANGLSQDAIEELNKTLDPSQEGIILNLEYTRGAQGDCSIGATFPVRREGPIDLSNFVYSDLESAYIKPGFDEVKYNALVKQYEEDMQVIKLTEEAKKSGNGNIRPEKAEEVKETNPAEEPVQEVEEVNNDPKPQPVNPESLVANPVEEPAEETNPSVSKWAKYRTKAS